MTDALTSGPGHPEIRTKTRKVWWAEGPYSSALIYEPDVQRCLDEGYTVRCVTHVETTIEETFPPTEKRG